MGRHPDYKGYCKPPNIEDTKLLMWTQRPFDIGTLGKVGPLSKAYYISFNFWAKTSLRFLNKFWIYICICSYFILFILLLNICINAAKPIFFCWIWSNKSIHNKNPSLLLSSLKISPTYERLISLLCMQMIITEKKQIKNKNQNNKI